MESWLGDEVVEFYRSDINELLTRSYKGVKLEEDFIQK